MILTTDAPIVEPLTPEEYADLYRFHRAARAAVDREAAAARLRRAALVAVYHTREPIPTPEPAAPVRTEDAGDDFPRECERARVAAIARYHDTPGKQRARRNALCDDKATRHPGSSDPSPSHGGGSSRTRRCECSDPFTARMTGHGHACPLYDGGAA
ncbi:hypothetical protein [Cellulomonas uda]|uniref:Uncharacterized protein n=1 Tax=Cellulomonas uda TaxID=1714 RepID=A0A4Y3K7G2_CELUD|nr:hypothetical protein [Cellulomonas uda]NII67800.1 hypothetical protein [Cellulomonas uda]GEA79953.1 hypothetical protein CUD01_03970 [Cellulomonas uda]